MVEIGRAVTNVAVGNRAGQQLLASIGFARDEGMQDVCRMVLTSQMYLKQYGEPNQSLEDTGA